MSEAELLSIKRIKSMMYSDYQDCDYYRCVFKVGKENIVTLCYVGKEVDDIPEFRDPIIEWCREEAVYVAHGKEAT